MPALSHPHAGLKDSIALLKRSNIPSSPANESLHMVAVSGTQGDPKAKKIARWEKTRTALEFEGVNLGTVFLNVVRAVLC